MLTTLSACSSDSNTKISNAIGIVSTVETSFTNHTGNNKLMVDAANALRSERNEICLRLWGLRQSLGNVNDRITKLELRPDRADVITHAGKIYLSIMEWTNTEKMIVPQSGLPDGIIHELYEEYNSN